MPGRCERHTHGYECALTISSLGIALHSPAGMQARRDVVAVPVGGDGAGGIEPATLPTTHIDGWLPRTARPWLTVGDSLLGQGSGATFDQLLPLGDSEAVLVAQRSEWFRDQASDETRP